MRRADLGELAADVVHEVELGHPTRGTRLSTRSDPVGEREVDLIREILCKLVTNAVRHGAQDSPVTVSVSGGGADEVVAAVHSLGAPIPQREWELIFQPFRRASSTRGDDGKGRRGTGLGLYIARRMAEAHGGTVRAEPSTEAGTTISMRLPRRLPERSSTSGEASAPA